ncbi:isopenicillin N synthase family dioxygenase [Pseudomonas indica]|uniref:isopenicillin N synthase family dioxygenase n=1 Tax=Pseudomonas indica TaxID=137658 RepID=UPI0023F78544|nr:2OG-Fe(II) oxygenase family protein [Pseudomonas indica]MBU3055413.1 MFS transporter [Pseudomonas indica]
MTSLSTFQIPKTVENDDTCRQLGKEIIAALQADGIFQISLPMDCVETTVNAFAESKRFFDLPFHQKSTYISELTYSGYIAQCEEVTAGEKDYSEIFTVCPDFPSNDSRVRDGLPCHGPTPWPNSAFRDRTDAFMNMLGTFGERLLRLIALGLDEEIETFTRLTEDGWHHMRILRFPTAQSSKSARGIGAHTDYGLLVIAAQDDVGGLYIRPPIKGERRNRNWLTSESSAGMYEHDEGWTFVEPVPAVLTVFPGDFLQFLTGGRLLSTPHKVRLNTRERFAMAYFHEPNFDTWVRPLDPTDPAEPIHYGTHFTRMFMRCYPQRSTTRRIERENLLSRLPLPETELA